jgi:hypothetical protein
MKAEKAANIALEYDELTEMLEQYRDIITYKSL